MFTLALRFIFLHGAGVISNLLISHSPIWLLLTFPVMFRIVLSPYPKSLNAGIRTYVGMYILTKRFRQDVLENNFGCQRTICSRKDNPTLRDFGYSDNTISKY